MKDEIIVDFNALDRIVKKLNTASSDLQSAMSILSSASLSQSGGAYTNLGTVRTSLKSVGGVVAASTAAQAVSNYGAAIRRLSARSRSLASGVKSASAAYRKTENGSRSQFSGARAVVKSIDASVIAENESWLWSILRGHVKGEGALLSGSNAVNASLLGLEIGGEASGSLFWDETSRKNKLNLKFKDKDGKFTFKSASIELEGKASGAVAKGKVKGNIGKLNGELEGKFVTGSASGTTKVTLWDDGKFNPLVQLEGKAEVSLLSGSGEISYGSDNYNAHVKADGDFLYASASGKLAAGRMEDINGNYTYGLSAEFDAMACVAKGKVKGGITIFGIDIDVSAKGYLGAVGVECGASATKNKVKAKLGGALGGGAGVEVTVDWSDMMSFGEIADSVGGYIEDVGDFLLGWW